jgi:hypothetical protein
VITDLIHGALASASPPPDENWAHDAGEPEGAASEMPLHQAVPPEPAESVHLFQNRGRFGSTF